VVRAHRAAIGAALLLLGGSEAARGVCREHLFVIARSKNANVVVYDAKVDPSGRLAAQPVSAYWLLGGDPARREELTSIEFNRAYGFTLGPGEEPETYAIAFKARRGRHATLRMHDGCPVVLVQIHGHLGILTRIYVKSKEGGLMPKVESIELFGEDATTGKPLHEKIAT
jgi:Domain of unknown function (DUF4833)